MSVTLLQVSLPVVAKKPKIELTQARLKELLHYDPLTGVFTRLEVLDNTAKIGDVAGGPHNAGYNNISVDGKRYLGHRLAWLYMTGTFPPFTIDHKDTDRSNDIWTNLREATRLQNNRNSSGWARSKSGVKGVYPAKALGRWEAKCEVLGKSTFLGTFDTIPEAKLAYDTYAKQIHGEYFKS